MKVLIVDDDATYRKLLATILKAKQHEVIETADGLAAWEQMQANPYSFLISDWMMPGLNGPDLIRRIRSANFASYTYIILLTARNAREDIVSGLEAGADDYLTKPFDLDELRARVSIGERILDLEIRLRRTMEQLQILATYDSLTGLLNRRALYEAAHHECTRAQRENKPLSLMILDIDHFKDVNDMHGHIVGDQALAHIAKVLQKCKRSYDLVGRWGGEEFLLVLPGTDLREAGIVADRLRMEIQADPIHLPNDSYLSLNASFGVARVDTSNCLEFDKYIQHADRALYHAKQGGRNQVCYYTGEANA